MHFKMETRKIIGVEPIKNVCFTCLNQMKWKYKKKIISNEMNSTNDAISLEIICNKSMANSENNEKAMENMRR